MKKAKEKSIKKCIFRNSNYQNYSLFFIKRKKDRSFSTGQKFKSYEDEGADLTRTKLNNEIEDLKYLNYTKQKQRDSFENNKSRTKF